MVVSAGRLESGNGSLIASLVTIRHRFRAFVCTSSPRRRDGLEESICCVPTGLKGVASGRLYPQSYLCRLVERGWHVQSITIYSARVAQRCGASSFIMGLSVASATVATKSLLYHLDPAPHQLGRRQISTLSWTAKLTGVGLSELD
ncbi:hypothetical protein BHM03_00022538 [Ensete ventricosum]|uniref:Uncharacterized protein n=1 Tax=Ensete ventricosum TaxID=4639 RepID=A0A445MGI1_ENSVE|nr:hypothetical protein BHM03_00022538 [Ensete ventricosum]